MKEDSIVKFSKRFIKTNPVYISDISEARDAAKRFRERTPAEVERTRKRVRKSILQYEHELAV